ncbi:MAG TPA: NUDIX hydrolase [Gemmataceae bacterium]|jgi:8-oxo-dGTP diphosphatase|nr:NUDIX hydrolase [Gemmataceae bacterium]
MPKGKYVYPYPRPMVTVDIVVVTRAESPEVLLVRRKNEPFADCCALPGGYLEIDETLEAAARRELMEETGVAVAKMIPLGPYDAVDRDPRGRTITFAYLARVPKGQVHPKAADDAAAVGWFPLRRPPALAFDHREILAAARKLL